MKGPNMLTNLIDESLETTPAHTPAPGNVRNTRWRHWAAVLLAFSVVLTAVIALGPTTHVAAVDAPGGESDDDFFERLEREAAEQASGTRTDPIELHADELTPLWVTPDSGGDASQYNRRWNRNNYPAGRYRVTEKSGAITEVQLGKSGDTTRIESVSYEMKGTQHWVTRRQAHTDKYNKLNPGLRVQSTSWNGHNVNIYQNLDDAGHILRDKFGGGDHVLNLFPQDSYSNQNGEWRAWERNLEELVKANPLRNYRISVSFSFGGNHPGRPSEVNIDVVDVEAAKSLEKYKLSVLNEAPSKDALVQQLGKAKLNLNDQQIRELQANGSLTGTQGGSLSIGLNVSRVTPVNRVYPLTFGNEGWRDKARLVIESLGYGDVLVRPHDGQIYVRVSGSLQDPSLKKIVARIVQEHRIAVVSDDFVVHVDDGRIVPWTDSKNTQGYDALRATYSVGIQPDTYEAFKPLLTARPVQSILNEVFSGKKAFSLRIVDAPEPTSVVFHSALNPEQPDEIRIQRSANQGRMLADLLFELHNAARRTEYLKIWKTRNSRKRPHDPAADYATQMMNVEAQAVAAMEDLVSHNVELSELVPVLPHTRANFQFLQNGLFESYRTAFDSNQPPTVFKPTLSMAAALHYESAVGHAWRAEAQSRIEEFGRLIGSEETAEVTRALESLRAATQLVDLAGESVAPSDDLVKQVRDGWEQVGNRYGPTVDAAVELHEQSVNLVDRAEAESATDVATRQASLASDTNRRSVMLLVQAKAMFDGMRFAQRQYFGNLELPDDLSGGIPARVKTQTEAASGHSERVTTRVLGLTSQRADDLIDRVKRDYRTATDDQQTQMRREAAELVLDSRTLDSDLGSGAATATSALSLIQGIPDRVDQAFNSVGEAFDYASESPAVQTVLQAVETKMGPRFVRSIRGVVAIGSYAFLAYEVATGIVAIAESENGQVRFETVTTLAGGFAAGAAASWTAFSVMAALGGPLGLILGIGAGLAMSYMVNTVLQQVSDLASHALYGPSGGDPSTVEVDRASELAAVLKPVGAELAERLRRIKVDGGPDDVGVDGFTTEQLVALLKDVGLPEHVAWFAGITLMDRYGRDGEVADVLEHFVWTSDYREVFAPELEALLQYLHAVSTPPPPPNPVDPDHLNVHDAKRLFEFLGSIGAQDLTVDLVAVGLAGSQDARSAHQLLALKLVNHLDTNGDLLVNVGNEEYKDLGRLLQTLPRNGVAVGDSGVEYPEIGKIVLTATDAAQWNSMWAGLERPDNSNLPTFDINPGGSDPYYLHGHRNHQIAERLQGAGMNSDRADAIAELIIRLYGGKDRAFDPHDVVLDGLPLLFSGGQTICLPTWTSASMRGTTAVLKWESCGGGSVDIELDGGATDTHHFQQPAGTTSYQVDGLNDAVDGYIARIDFDEYHYVIETPTTREPEPCVLRAADGEFFGSTATIEWESCGKSPTVLLYTVDNLFGFWFTVVPADVREYSITDISPNLDTVDVILGNSEMHTTAKLRRSVVPIDIEEPSVRSADRRASNVADAIAALDTDRNRFLRHDEVAGSLTLPESQYLARLVHDGANRNAVSEGDLETAFERSLSRFIDGRLEMTLLGRVFARHDRDTDGVIEAGELNATEFTPERIEALASLDPATGSVIDLAPHDVAEALRRGLVIFDSDGLRITNAIDTAESLPVVAPPVTATPPPIPVDQAVIEIVELDDTDGNKFLRYDEVADWMDQTEFNRIIGLFPNPSNSSAISRRDLEAALLAGYIEYDGADVAMTLLGTEWAYT